MDNSSWSGAAYTVYDKAKKPVTWELFPDGHVLYMFIHAASLLLAVRTDHLPQFSPPVVSSAKQEAAISVVEILGVTLADVSMLTVLEHNYIS